MIMDPIGAERPKLRDAYVHVPTVCASAELVKPETNVTRLAMAHSFNLSSSPPYFRTPPRFRFPH
jgi:hypothetical protein